jgi:hypothetical protein
MAEVVEDIFNAVVMIVMCGGHVNTFSFSKQERRDGTTLKPDRTQTEWKR